MNTQNILVVLILAIVCIFAVRGCLKKKGHGCCGSGNTVKLKVRDKNPEHYPYSAEISIEGMTCNNCKLRVENAFHETGKMWAHVDLKNGTAKVQMKEPATEEELSNLITRAGYRVTAVRRICS